jgi:hypothetical protein
MNAVHTAIEDHPGSPLLSTYYDILHYYEKVYRDLQREMHDTATHSVETWGQDPRRLSASSAWDGVFEGMSTEGMQALKEYLRSTVVSCPYGEQAVWCCESAPMDDDSNDDTESTAAISDSTALSIFSDDSDEDEARNPSPRIDIPLHSAEMPVLLSWMVSAREFCTKKHQIVSPTIEICEQISCRIILKPTPPSKRGPASFLKSSGRGSVEFELVKNEGGANLCGVAVSIGKDGKQQLNHDFERNPVCQVGEQKDFLSAVTSNSCIPFSIEVVVRMLANH